MSKIELEDLITSFKSANQSLRKRAIALGVLMILAIALRYSENARFEKVSELVGYQYALERIVELPDSSFHALVDGDSKLEEEYFFKLENDEEGNRYRLFEKVRLDDYKRDLISKTIDEIEGRIENYNQKQSIGILGITIPLEPVAYLSLVFVLIVFHDFTLIIIVRNHIYRRIRLRKIPQWKLGIEFFGFHNTMTNTSALKFMRFASSLITAMFIVCPLVTSFLMMDLNKSNSDFLFLVNFVCFLLIIVDTIIIFHTENIGNFRYFCNFYLGRHNVSLSKMKILWGFSLFWILGANLFLGAFFIKELGISGVWYCLMSLIPPIPLFFILIYTYKNPTKRNRAIRSGLLLLNIFWLIVTFQACSLKVSEREIYELWGVLLGVCIFCGLFSLIYMKFFMDVKKINRKLPKVKKS